MEGKGRGDLNAHERIEREMLGTTTSPESCLDEINRAVAPPSVSFSLLAHSLSAGLIRNRMSTRWIQIKTILRHGLLCLGELVQHRSRDSFRPITTILRHCLLLSSQRSNVLTTPASIPW
jgi:hypothetical protein